MAFTTSPLRRAGAECIGTYALVTAGCGAIVVDRATGAVTHIGVAFTFGLVIMVMIAAAGHLSGAHFNPAVTFAFALTRHFPWSEVPMYAGGQIIGATGGALTLRALFGPVANLGATLPSGSAGQSLGLEVLLSAVLMFVIVAVATDTRAVGELAALAIGATVGLDALWGGPVSGASMNPARSLGPALIAGAWRGHWIYWLGPLMGTSLGATLYQWLRTPLEDAVARTLGGSAMSDAPKTARRVLFLCTHNSARSQMAEGLLRSLGAAAFEAHSAGTIATRIRPEAIAAMRELQIDISGQESKTLERFLNEPFDEVITVCDNANETCPIFPNARSRRHWSIDDPAAVQGAEAERMAAFRRARDELRARIEQELLAGRG